MAQRMFFDKKTVMVGCKYFHQQVGFFMYACICYSKKMVLTLVEKRRVCNMF